MLITHNLGIIAEACDRVAVMYGGKIVEEGDARDVFADPQHPYTRELLRLDDLARDKGAAHHPRRAAQPRHAATGMPVPSPLPRRDAHLRRQGAQRDPARRRATGGVLAPLHDPTSPRARRRPSKREELALANEA